MKKYLASTMQTQSHELLNERYPEIFELFHDVLVTTEELPKSSRRFFSQLREGIEEEAPEVHTIYCIDSRPSIISAANKHRKYKAVHFKSPRQLKVFLLDQFLADAQDHHILAEPILLAEPSDG